MIYLLLTWIAFPVLWLQAKLRGSAEPQSFAVIQTAKIGDFVCTTPLFREIKRRYPKSKLFVIAHEMNTQLAEHNPHIDGFIQLPPRGLHGMQGRRWLFQILSSRHIDTTVCVSPSLTAFMAPLWAGVARRLAILPNIGGRSYRLAEAFLTHTERHQTGRLLLDSEWALLRQIGVTPHRSDKEVWPAPDANTKVSDFLGSSTSTLIGLGISSGNQLKAMKPSQLLEVAEGILHASTARIVLVGSAMDRESVAPLLLALPPERIINAVGAFSLADLPALLMRLTAYVGVDSGITYLAEASGIPVVDIMGPADANDQCPTGPKAVVLRTNLPCAPCSHAFSAPYHCAIGTRICVLELSTQRVISAIKSILTEKSNDY